MKKFFWTIEKWEWSIRCRYNFWLHGAYGLTRIIERMPFRFLIPFMQKYGATIGKGVIIDSGVKFHRPDKIVPLKNLVIHDDVYIGHNMLFDLSAQITIHNNVGIGANCQIWTHVGDYKYRLRDKNDYHEFTSPVVLNEGVVCYSSVIINPGVEIGQKARVLAGSMVSGNIPDKQIWAGIPARYLKERSL